MENYTKSYEQNEFKQFWIGGLHPLSSCLSFAFYLCHLCLLPSGVLLCYIMQLFGLGKEVHCSFPPTPSAGQVNASTLVNRDHQYDQRQLANTDKKEDSKTKGLLLLLETKKIIMTHSTTKT